MMEDYIPVRTKRDTRRIFLDEIVYIEKNLRKVIVYTLDNEISFYGKMDDVKKYLDQRFLICHRSYIFNMDRIIHMANQTVYMQNNQSVFLGRETFRKAKKCFSQYLNLKNI